MNKMITTLHLCRTTYLLADRAKPVPALQTPLLPTYLFIHKFTDPLATPKGFEMVHKS